MKNLILCQHATFEFPELSQNKSALFCTDPQTGDIFVCRNDVIYCHSNDDPNLKVLFDWNSYHQSTTSYNSPLPIIIGICFNSLTETLCIAIENGDVLTIDKLGEVECVGCVPSGLKVMEWSYDQEVVVLVTGEDTVIVMTATFDPVVEVNLDDGGFGEKQFVTVGWGKKETQFHGSEGKSSALSKLVAASTDLRQDDGKPRISWRGDGDLFAVSVLESNGERCVRIFSRDGILQYTSEVVAGLEAPLAWRPSGNLIASTQRLAHKHQVAFFEKNGLPHGEFTIPFDHNEVSVHKLSWNNDSSILAIWLQHRSTLKSFVQLWTSSNYHWYLKQSLEFGIEETPFDIGWFENRLDIIDTSGRYQRFVWSWAINKSRGHTSEDGAYVAVIDGTKVLLSGFRSAIPPPPMCSWSADMTSSVNAIMFAPNSSNHLCAVLSNGRLAFIDPDQREIQRIVSLTDCTIGLAHHWVWITSDQMLCCTSNGINSNIHTVDIGSELILRNKCLVDGSVISIVSNGQKVVVQFSEGDLFHFDVIGNALIPLYKLPEPCALIELSKDCILSLSKRNRLYLDNHEIANNVTSFVTRLPFILITTLQHRLFCMKLDDVKKSQANALQALESKVTEMNINQEVANMKVNQGRRIERGARLVTIVPVATRVVLQMPRGNLETIQPRTLCLNVAAEYLDKKEYRRAFELFRKQRINLNLLCDHRLEQFLDNTNHFVEEIEDPNWLSLFFSELLDEDLTETMYAEYYSKQVAVAKPGKVAKVCQNVRAAMLDREDAKHFLLPILASHVRQGCLGDALTLANKNTSALKFLSCLVDVNVLYDTALGLYDLQLAAFVASHSQKDPKEYLPFLNNIHKMDPVYQRYFIDEHLKRYESALRHIAKCPGEDHLKECIALIKNHKLYQQALEVFPKSSHEDCQVASAYAEYLTSQKQHGEAAAMFCRSGDKTQALEAYIVNGDWREALLIAADLNLPVALIHDICRKRLIPDLVNARRHQEAASVFEDVLKDSEEAIAVLVQGRFWDQAMSLLEKSKRPDMIETHIKPGMDEQLRQLTDQVQTSTQLFRNHRDRLNVVLTSKQKTDDNLVDENLPEDCDLFSDRSSVSTRSRTASSGRSSTFSRKNRRKQERKLLSLREGGAFEDLALIRALHQLVTSTCAIQEDVGNLCRLMRSFNRVSDVRALQEALTNILQEMERDKAKIWTPELANESVGQVFGPNDTTNSILAALQSTGQQTVVPSLLEPHLRIAPIIVDITSPQMDSLSGPS